MSQSSLAKILKNEMRFTLQHIFNIIITMDISPEGLFSLNGENFVIFPKHLIPIILTRELSANNI